jgi:hypothetical protein
MHAVWIICYKYYGICLSTSRAMLLAGYYLILSVSTKFEILENPSKFWIEIMTLEIQANIVGSDKFLIDEGRLCMYIMMGKGPCICSLWDSMLYCFPLWELVNVSGDFILHFSFLFVRQYLKPSAATTWILMNKNYIVKCMMCTVICFC